MWGVVTGAMAGLVAGSVLGGWIAHAAGYARGAQDSARAAEDAAVFLGHEPAEWDAALRQTFRMKVQFLKEQSEELRRELRK